MAQPPGKPPESRRIAAENLARQARLVPGEHESHPPDSQASDAPDGATRTQTSGDRPTEPVTDAARLLRLYEAVLNNTPDLAYVFDLDHRFIYANEGLLRMWGKTWAEATGRTCLELGYPDWHAEMHDREIEQVVATRQPIRGEVPFSGTFGRRIYDYIFVPVFSPDGQVEAVAGTTRDITEVREAEQALSASEDRFRRLAESMPQLVWTANVLGHIEYYNSQGEEYDGLGHSSDGEQYWRPTLHPEDLDRTREAWRIAVASEHSYECEHRVRMVDGTYQWHLTRADRVETDGAVQWYGTSTNIHGLKQADELKDEFLAIASHELRNPVAAVHGLAQQLNRARNSGNLTPERLEAYAAGLLSSSTYLARLTNDLMDVSRLQRGRLPLQPEPTDVTAVIEEVVFLDEFPTARIRPELAADLGVVHLDRARIRQVLANLLDNALKYSPDDEPVRIATRRDAGGVLIEVIDRGIGLPADALEAIFTPFGRASNTGSIAGLGMGLYIAREIAERHGGRLWATSDGEGLGATLSLWIPTTTAEESRRDPGASL